MGLIKFSELKKSGKIKNLIPVHANKMKCDTYFWHWNRSHSDWIRGNKIPN